MALDGFEKLRSLMATVSKFSALAKAADPYPERLRSLLNTASKSTPGLFFAELKNKAAFGHSPLRDLPIGLIGRISSSLEQVMRVHNAVNNNPELQFLLISDLQLLNYQTTDEFKDSIDGSEIEEALDLKETLVEQNLVPLLETLKVENLWDGANYAFHDKGNPDRIRHVLISLRTLLEYMIEIELAPNHLLASDQRFEKDFKNYNHGQTKLEAVKIPRWKRIEYFSSKVQFGLLEDFTKKDIDFICQCYSALCDVHQANIPITEHQLRILKVKTGITLWLLAYINEIIKES